jgi:hypothetical protein
MSPIRNSSKDLELLSELLFSGKTPTENGQSSEPVSQYQDTTLDAIYRLSIAELEKLRRLAYSNHVLLRSFQPLREILEDQGKFAEAQFARAAIETEKGRIRHALAVLHEICSYLDEADCPVTVIKSLDHWPDLGSDLDLYSGADASRIIDRMKARFRAKVAGRSWGDKLANKWNFEVPGLPELVELHAGRLGQTGEQTAVVSSLAARSRWADINGYVFRLAAPEDQFVISTLQRMYRHFYIRLCDILDNATLFDSEKVDFHYLRRLGDRTGLRDGIASYLVIISDYVKAYRGYGLQLPAWVSASGRIDVAEIAFRREFLRVPIVPHSVVLYASELKHLLRRGDIVNSFRLTLMPGLATAALLEQKITGSDKGIW